MPVCKETLQFFNMQLGEKESPARDTVEQGKPTGKSLILSQSMKLSFGI